MRGKISLLSSSFEPSNSKDNSFWYFHQLGIVLPVVTKMVVAGDCCWWFMVAVKELNLMLANCWCFLVDVAVMQLNVMCCLLVAEYDACWQCLSPCRIKGKEQQQPWQVWTKYCSSSTHRNLYSGIVLGAMGKRTDQSSICCWIRERASRSKSRFSDNIGEDYPIMLLLTYRASKTPQETMEFLCDSCSISSIEKAWALAPPPPPVSQLMSL
jgi:hypothetical protein